MKTAVLITNYTLALLMIFAVIQDTSPLMIIGAIMCIIPSTLSIIYAHKNK